jgi:hypothetical protein
MFHLPTQYRNNNINIITQEVCEHFEGILKMMNLLKQLVSSHVPGGVGSHRLRSTGILTLLPPGPASEGLGSAIHSSCVELIQHIVNQAQPFLTSLSPHSKEKKSKEVGGISDTLTPLGPGARGPWIRREPETTYKGQKLRCLFQRSSVASTVKTTM